jgi:hypothetical protein
LPFNLIKKKHFKTIFPSCIRLFYDNNVVGLFLGSKWIYISEVGLVVYYDIWNFEVKVDIGGLLFL